MLVARSVALACLIAPAFGVGACKAPVGAQAAAASAQPSAVVVPSASAVGPSPGRRAVESWTTVLTVDAPGRVRPRGIVATPDGGFLVAAELDGRLLLRSEGAPLVSEGGDDVVVLRFDARGAPAASGTRLGSAGDDAVVDFVAVEDGALLVVDAEGPWEAAGRAIAPQPSPASVPSARALVRLEATGSIASALPLTEAPFDVAVAALPGGEVAVASELRDQDLELVGTTVRRFDRAGQTRWCVVVADASPGDLALRGDALVLTTRSRQGLSAVTLRLADGAPTDRAMAPRAPMGDWGILEAPLQVADGWVAVGVMGGPTVHRDGQVLAHSLLPFALRWGAGEGAGAQRQGIVDATATVLASATVRGTLATALWVIHATNLHGGPSAPATGGVFAWERADGSFSTHELFPYWEVTSSSATEGLDPADAVIDAAGVTVVGQGSAAERALVVARYPLPPRDSLRGGRPMPWPD